MTKTFPLLVLLVTLLAACSDDANRVGQLSGSTMGTTWSVKFVGTPDQGAADLKRDLQSALEKINDEMSTYQPDSVISRFNQAEEGDTVLLPPDFVRVLEQALALSEATDGAYDITVGPLVNLWGFGPDPDRADLPADDDIQAARERVDWRRLKVNGGRKLTQPGDVYMDLSSIAKGFAVDRLAGLLEEHGLDNYLVEIGGELRGAGEKPGGQPWRVAVERPKAETREIEQIIALRGLSIASSGDYRNFFEVDGKEYSHTIDPRTGYPVDHKLASVTVLHSSCMIADGLATALTVLGPEQGMALAEERDLAVLFIVRTDDGPREMMTPAFQERLEADAGGN